jgi:hypothetical protein
VVPPEWLDAIETASRTDVRATGRLMGAVARDIADRDRERLRARLTALEGLAEARS